MMTILGMSAENAAEILNEKLPELRVTFSASGNNNIVYSVPFGVSIPDTEKFEQLCFDTIKAATNQPTFDAR